MRRFVNGLSGASPDFIRREPDHEGNAPSDLFATAWFYRSARLASRIAGVLGNLSDLEEFEALASRVRGAFTRRFVTADGRIVGDSIEAYSLALGFGLLEPPVEKLAARVLFELCEGALIPRNASRGSLLEVPLLLDALTRLGRLDLAYRVSLAGPCAEPDAGLSEWLYTTLAGFQLSRDLSERSIAVQANSSTLRSASGGMATIGSSEANLVSTSSPSRTCCNSSDRLSTTPATLDIPGAGWRSAPSPTTN